jgi:DNA segregation ATPase FtsK/SpoIIIE, S-DNA-T family
MATKNTRTSSSNAKKKSNTGSASRKTASSGKRSSRKRRRSKKQSRIYRENALFISISVISLLLMVSVLGHGGSFGELFRELQFGFSGLLAYVFPIFLFALSVYLYVGKKKNHKFARAFVYVILFIFVCFFVQLVSGDYAGG